MKLKTIGEFVKFLRNFVENRIPQHSELFNEYLKTNSVKLKRIQGQRVTEKWRSEFCTELCNMFLMRKNCPKVHDKSNDLLVTEFRDLMAPICLIFARRSIGLDKGFRASAMVNAENNAEAIFAFVSLTWGGFVESLGDDKYRLDVENIERMAIQKNKP